MVSERMDPDSPAAADLEQHCEPDKDSEEINIESITHDCAQQDQPSEQLNLRERVQRLEDTVRKMVDNLKKIINRRTRNEELGSDNENEDGNNIDMSLLKRKCRAASSASVAVRELAAIVFTKDELISSSVRGLKTHKDKQAKSCLPPKKLEKLHIIIKKYHDISSGKSNQILGDKMKYLRVQGNQ
ncbi:uncharacterized protein LOC134196558 isoform X1 [Corticium candelabrum]|uniref:uncharacterized protein LOC134196558 isoform X1 n=1 Tax=Corticium candelabrum TaxID=121492 RepID=UPI002E25AD35|nr:uncharacterized protein LOC134196558 isoform X1 [Corticium candelabrum]